MSAISPVDFSPSEVGGSDRYNETECRRVRRFRPWSPAEAVPSAADELLRVLIVDDHRCGAEIMALLLKRWGYSCQIACDGNHALAAADEFNPHVLMVDILMPTVSGTEVVTKVRENRRLRDCLVIALTGCTDDALRRQCQQAGVDYYFIKPMDTVLLKSLLAREAGLAALAPTAATGLAPQPCKT